MIKTYKEDCEKLGLNPNNLPDVCNLPVKHQKSVIAYYALVNNSRGVERRLAT